MSHCQVARSPLRRTRRGRVRGAGMPLGLGLGTMWLSLVVLVPLGRRRGQVDRRRLERRSGTSVSSRQAVAALELTLVASLVVAAINAVMGTLSPGCSSATSSPAAGWSTR